MPPKKEKKVMSLSEFASMVQTEAPEIKGSWADEDIELPSAPVSLNDGFTDDRYSSGDRIGRGPRDGPPPPPIIDYARLPTSAPFVAFVANLPFEISDADLKTFFQALKVRDIKIPLDQERRGRGFAIVEFDDQDSLIKALLSSGQTLKGRYVRIDVSEGRAYETKSFASDWRSGVPHQVNERGSSGRPNFDRGPAGPERVFDRSQMAPVMAERPGRPNFDRGSSRQEPVFDRSQMAPITADTGAFRNTGKDWRSNAAPVQASSSGAPKIERPVLNLLPRSKPISTDPAQPAEVYASKGKANPFGAAKPVKN